MGKLIKMSFNENDVSELIRTDVEISGRVSTAKEHASDPIKNVEDIERLSDWYISHQRWRDNMLFVVGINLGLRVSDLRTLRFADLIDESGQFRDGFAILEKKTSKTRKKPKNRHLTINAAVREAVTLYLKNTDNVSLDDYLFTSESNNGGKKKPMHRNSIERVLKAGASAVGLTCHVATHTLRKTFGYHQMMMSGNDPRKLLLLQKMFGHSTSAQTLDYIGLTQEEMTEAYLSLNLGMRDKSKQYAPSSTCADTDLVTVG